VLKIVKKEGANQGRHYWSCPNSQAASCAFFEWEDDPATAVAVAPLNTRTQSAGSQQTTGECFNCGQPGHWASACNAGPQRNNNLKRSKTTIPSKSKGSGPGGGGVECFKCGKEGHYSKDCPDPGFPTGASRGSGRKASSSRGTSRGRGRGGKKAVSKPRGKTGAFKAADDDWD